MLPDRDNADDAGQSGPPDEIDERGEGRGPFPRRSVPSDQAYDNRAQDEIFITVDKLRLFLDFWDDQRTAITREHRHRSYAGSALLVCLTCVITLVTADQYQRFLFGAAEVWKAFFVALAGASFVAGIYFAASCVVGAGREAARRRSERRAQLDPQLPAHRPATPQELLEAINARKTHRSDAITAGPKAAWAVGSPCIAKAASARSPAPPRSIAERVRT